MPVSAGIDFSERQQGFTLIELSVVLIVIALITGMGMVATLGTLESARRAQTENKLDAIEKALAAFRIQYNRLPCPGDITMQDYQATYGLEAANLGTCTGGTPAATDISGNGGTPPPNAANPPVVQGGVPARTLGLPDEFMFDGWGRRFLYAVDANGTVTNAFNFIPVSANRCAIRVKNAAGAYRSGSATAGGAIYTLLSHGPNGHGAYGSGSTRLSVGSTNTDELDNCNCTATGATGTVNANFVQKEATENSGVATDVFDDIVRFKERWQLQNDADAVDTRGTRRCQFVVGIWDGPGGNDEHDVVNCYQRGCDGWFNPSTVATTTYLGTPNATSRIANVFFAPDNSYVHATFSRTDGVSCSTPNFGVCVAALDVSMPTGTTFYCSFSCPDDSLPLFTLSNNNYFAALNTETIPLQLFRLSGTTFTQLNTASAITPPITGYMPGVIYLFAFSKNAEYFFATDFNDIRIYKKYEPDVFKEIDASKYPPSLPIGSDISTVAFSPDGRFLALGDWNSQVIIWSIGEGNPFVSGGDPLFGAAPEETIVTSEVPYSIAFSPDMQYLAIGVMNYSTNDIADSIKIYKIEGTTFTPIAIASGAPNIFYGTGGNHAPFKLMFTADSNSLIIVTDDPDAGIVTLDRLDGTTFQQRIGRVPAGDGAYTTFTDILH